LGEELRQSHRENQRERVESRERKLIHHGSVVLDVGCVEGVAVPDFVDLRQLRERAHCQESVHRIRVLLQLESIDGENLAINFELCFELFIFDSARFNFGLWQSLTVLRVSFLVDVSKNSC
jgi:hypothetical protein